MSANHVSLSELTRDHLTGGDVFAKGPGEGETVRIRKSMRLPDFYASNVAARVMPPIVVVHVPVLDLANCDAVRARLVELGAEGGFEDYAREFKPD